MSEPLPLRRPSDRIDELRDQLLRELKRLESGDDEESGLFRAYLRHAQALAWQGVAEGRMETPRELLNALRAAEPFVFSHLEESPNPLAGAAQEVHFTLRALRLATEALGERRIEDRLADDRSQTEREILRVLANNRDRYLRRGAIHKRLELKDPPTPARVGQILVELDAEGLLLRIHGRAQGNPNAAFYALSDMGLEVAHNLSLEKDDLPQIMEADDLRIENAINRVLNPATSEKHRELLINMLANMSFGQKWLQILATLKREASQKGPETQVLYKMVLRDLYRTRYMALTRGQPAEQPGAKSSGTLKFDSQSDEEKAARAEALSVEAEMAAV